MRARGTPPSRGGRDGSRFDEVGDGDAVWSILITGMDLILMWIAYDACNIDLALNSTVSKLRIICDIGRQESLPCSPRSYLCLVNVSVCILERNEGRYTG